jgi:subtilisin family serine protease
MSVRFAGGISLYRLRLGAILGAIFFCALLGAAAEVRAFDDPYYSYYQDSQPGTSGYYGQLLGLPHAWSYSTGSSSVIVAILDTGVNVDTPDLAGRLLPAQAPTGLSILDGVTLSHGTQMASIVAMGIDDGIGGAGVGNFSILPITITDGAGHNDSTDVANAIIMAADAGAKVINISHSTLRYSALNSAAIYARDRGALVIVAAGNSNSYVDYSAYPDLVFVSGTDKENNRWVATPTTGSTGSVYGPGIDIAAPARQVFFADPTFAGGYGLGTGTSDAAALVSGAAALAWSINPNLTPDEVRDILFSTATDLGDPGWDQVYGNGLLNIGAVAEAAYATTPEPATLVMLAAGGSMIMALRRRRH